MTDKQKSDVDIWLEQETEHSRKALESASRYFDENDALTVNTLEAIYGKESSFGSRQGSRGDTDPAGHFQLEKSTAQQYNLAVSKGNDQRFDIDYASSAAARYLKDLNSMFGKKTILSKKVTTIPVENISERKKFILGAYNGGQRRIAQAQYLAEQAGENPRIWSDVEKFLEKAGATKAKVKEIRNYVEDVLSYEVEFTQESPADKKAKEKKARSAGSRCTEGRWVTIDDRPVFICD